MIPKPVPCRIYAILARKASTAAVFRRGPSKWVQLLRWNLEGDTFEPGQWFHGRIHERGADLSPNGRYLIYFASKQQNYGRMQKLVANERMTWEEAHEAAPPNWTAISRPPYLTALAFWPKANTYDGGGLFESSNRLLIDDFLLTPPQFSSTPKQIPHDFKIIANLTASGEHSSIMEMWLIHNGWEVQKSPVELPADTSYGFLYQGQTLPEQRVKLALGIDGLAMVWVQLGHSPAKQGVTKHRYGLTRTAQKQPFFWLPQGTEWADWDGARGRLVWAFDGKLWALPVLAGEDLDLSEAKILIDLDPNKPEAIIAPDWARRW